MKLTKTIPLEADNITADILANLAAGESVTAYCETLADKDNARQNAYYCRKNIPRPDGNTYRVETSNINQTVTVSVVPMTQAV